MTEIKIKQLRLENFKCHPLLTLDFMGGNASIYGNNATGKTSIYDALTWLLFGKDSAGNGEKNIEIKPLDSSGEVRDHDALTAVEATLLVNGEEINLRRTYREVWATKRGSSEAVFDGNTSEYYVDGVPCKKNAFQERVGELVSEDTFRMLTSVSYFASALSWQDRRAVLFQVAGVQDDAQILQTDARFLPLIEGMGKLTLDDYKKKLLAEKRGFVGAKTEIPARISECQKTIEDLRDMDFVAAKTEVAALTAQRDGISQQILAIEHDSAADQKRLEIREAQLEIDTLERENNAFRATQNIGTMCAEGIRRDISMLQTRLSNRKSLMESAEITIGNCDKQIEESRARWVAINGETFAAGNCPTCGQALPNAQLRKAMDSFERSKADRLREVEKTAAAMKNTKEQAEDRFQELLEDIRSLENQIQEKEQELAALDGMHVEIKDLDGYAEKMQTLRSRHTFLSGELSDMMRSSGSVKERLRKEMSDLNAKITDLSQICAKESLLSYSRKRVEELRQDAKNAAERLEAIEKMLFLMDEYSRYKTQFVEDSINGQFRIARFRLFREQANGGIEDRCDVVLDGVPYININNGAKVNVGIDIINTLSRAYGVTVPLFIDNAEAVTQLEPCNAQVIRLVVSEDDKELRLE